MIRENHIAVIKTARYYTLGELNKKTRQVWIVIHGFRQSANSFISEFAPLASDHIFFIAPEALNRFYIDRQGTETGATWMTRDDRLNEIKDYINYLNQLYQNFNLSEFDGKITALGFSQGASTLTRWLDVSTQRFDRAVVYAGEVAPELLPLRENSGLRRTKNFYICGTRDKFFTPEKLALVKTAYSDLNFEQLTFDGEHTINADSLSRLVLADQ